MLNYVKIIEQCLCLTLMLPFVLCATTECFVCKHLTDPSGCKNFGECPDGQKCYKELIESDNETALYSWGCASAQLCILENSIAGRRKRLGIERCYDCCDGNFCNFGPCKIDYCSKITCQNGGSCRNTVLKEICDCHSGYTGRYCETEINECNSNPCQNGAKCTDFVGSYSCTCLPGFRGVNCEININECGSNPCHSGATCIDGANSFTCACPHGYIGVLCQVDINECASNPCQHHSTCIDQINGYKCACPPGITGTNCEIDINDCANVTCLNQAKCHDFVNGFECRCTLGFTGEFCQTSVGRVCYDCEGVQDVTLCGNQTVCKLHEECYIEHELISPGVFSFTLGCVPVQMCEYLHVSKRRNTRPAQLCYECCNTNGCNSETCADTRGPSIG